MYSREYWCKAPVLQQSITYLEDLGPLWDEDGQAGLAPGPGLGSGRTLEPRLGRELRRLYEKQRGRSEHGLMEQHAGGDTYC
jgi:hypothetical protein